MLSFTELAVDLAGADSYFTASADAGWLTTDGDRAASLLRGQRYIAGVYNGRWIIPFDNDDAPDAVKLAIYEAGKRELLKPGSLIPDHAGGQLVKSSKAGAVEVVYQDGAPIAPRFPLIDALLGAFIRAQSGTAVTMPLRA